MSRSESLSFKFAYKFQADCFHFALKQGIGHALSSQSIHIHLFARSILTLITSSHSCTPNLQIYLVVHDTLTNVRYFSHISHSILLPWSCPNRLACRTSPSSLQRTFQPVLNLLSTTTLRLLQQKRPSVLERRRGKPSALKSNGRRVRKTVFVIRQGAVASFERHSLF